MLCVLRTVRVCVILLHVTVACACFAEGTLALQSLLPSFEHPIAFALF